MIKSDNYNFRHRILLLARPSDSLRSAVSGALGGRDAVYADYSCVFEVIRHIEAIADDEWPVLITRPSMISTQAARHLLERRPRLHLIGWLERHESPSDCAFADLPAAKMTMVCRPEQLAQCMEHVLAGADAGRKPDMECRQEKPDMSQRLGCTLSDAEINAILGTVHES